MNKDVTEWVDYENPDDEFLPIIECICGKRFEPWEFTISIYDFSPTTCSECSAKLFFQSAVRVYQVVDDE